MINQHFKYTLSIIIPCFNEIRTIKEIIFKVKNSPIQNKEIIIIDNCSTDGTREFLEKINDDELTIVFNKEKYRERWFFGKRNFNSFGQITLIQDADLEYDPAEYEKLIAPILSGKADVVYGSRFVGEAPHRVLYFWHRVGNGF